VSGDFARRKQVERWLLCGVLALLALAIPGCGSEKSAEDVAAMLMSPTYELTIAHCSETDTLRAVDPGAYEEGSRSFHCTFGPDPEWGTTQGNVELDKDGKISTVSYLYEDGQEAGRTINFST